MLSPQAQIQRPLAQTLPIWVLLHQGTSLGYFFPMLSSARLCELTWLSLRSHHWGSEKGGQRGQVGSLLTSLS